jgi:hypothetical protein
VATGTITPMGNVYDYFAAADDVAALSVFANGPREDLFGTIGLKGVEPRLMLGGVEACLTGLPVQDIEEDPRFTQLLSDPGHEYRWLVSLTDRLRDALAAAPPTRLYEAATAWTSSEDGAGTDPELMADFLVRLAALAGHARQQGCGLYCRMSL